MAWDVTVASTCAVTYIQSSASVAGSAAESAAIRKVAKYSELPASLRFMPIAFKSQGQINAEAASFLKDLSRRISIVSGDVRETTFLFQRLSVAVQRLKSILVHQSFVLEEAPDI